MIRFVIYNDKDKI